MITAGVITVGSQYRFQATITKNGRAWDLTSATVTIYFKKPDKTTVFSRNATILVAAVGQVYYDCSTLDLDTPGEWTRAWQVVLGGVTDRTAPVAFTVLASP